VIRCSPGAAGNLDALLAHYEERGRPEATAGLLTAIERASARIKRTPGARLPAPRPYPSLASDGRRWIKEGTYWIAYSTTEPPVIPGVFYETADIPRRV
jgi:plasmid stabilization system protein ParE